MSIESFQHLNKQVNFYYDDNNSARLKMDNLFIPRAVRIDYLRTVPLFSELTKKQLNEIARYSELVPMKTGVHLAYQGGKGYDFIFILEGKANVVKDGKVINSLSAGDYFGEISLIDGQPQTATVTPKNNGTVLVIHKRDFNHILFSIPGLMKKVLLSLCKYIRRAENAA